MAAGSKSLPRRGHVDRGDGRRAGRDHGGRSVEGAVRGRDRDGHDRSHHAGGQSGERGDDCGSVACTQVSSCSAGRLNANRVSPSLAQQLQPPVHPLGQLAGDGQTEAAAGRAGGLAAVEPLEQVAGGLIVDGGAVVGHIQPHAAVVGGDRDAHLRARRVVPDGVVEQRPAHLLHPQLVPDRVRQVGVRLHQRDAAAMADGQPAELAHQPTRRGGHVDRLVLHRHGVGVQPRQVEQVGGELGEAVHLLPHLLQERGPRLVVEILVVQQLHEPAQREQRRAQLVRGVGDELLAHAVGAVEAGLHQVERAPQLAQLVGRLVADGTVELAERDPPRALLEVRAGGG